jgi:hypothetical protein
MKSICQRSLTRVVFALVLVTLVPTCLAQPVSDSTPTLDKHARKIRHLLVRYPSGTYVNVALRDGSQTAGALDKMNASSFTIINAENNVPETHGYIDVAKIQKGREYIGEGSERHVHWVRWGIAGAAVAGAAVAAVAVR